MSLATKILRPDVLWIEGRCYRANDASTDLQSFTETDLYDNEFITTEMEDDEENEDYEVQQMGDDRFSTKFHVSKHYLGCIIGKKGVTRSRIEHDTRTEIKVPRQGRDGDVVIVGPSSTSVKTARRRIDMIVMSSRLKQRPTHFISIPMNSDSIMENFIKFKESILQDSADRGLDESLFILPTKLHLTVGVMCLMDNEERMCANKLFIEARDNIVLPLLKQYQPLKIRLKGISYMNDEPKSVHVVYGLVTEENGPAGILQRLADDIVDYFSKKGFMKVEFGSNSVKLHVTLMNSKYRTDQELVQNPDRHRRPRRVAFDATHILEQFGDYDFGVAELTDMHLSQMHVLGPDGYYQPSCVLSCSSNSSL